MTFIFKNNTILWDISKWNRGQKKWDGESIFIRQVHGLAIGMDHLGHNMSNTLPQTKGESLSLEGLEYIA